MSRKDFLILFLMHLASAEIMVLLVCTAIGTSLFNWIIQIPVLFFVLLSSSLAAASAVFGDKE